MLVIEPIDRLRVLEHLVHLADPMRRAAGLIGERHTVRTCYAYPADVQLLIVCLAAV
jgi:hypothetical protein